MSISLDKLKTLQLDIESCYGVKMYPQKSTYQIKLLEFYLEKKFLTKKQIECIKNAKYPIKGI